MDAQHHVPGALNSGAHRMVDRTDSRREAHERGTSRSSKLPDMESLPPMGHAQVDLGHERAEQRRGGLPQRSGRRAANRNYSWNVRYANPCKEKPRGHELGHALDNREVRAPMNWLAYDRYGLKSQDMRSSCWSRPGRKLGDHCHGGRKRRAPPKGMSTVLAPIVESNISTRPCSEATLRSVTTLLMRSAKLSPAQRGA